MTLEELEDRAGRLTERWLDAICTGSAAEAAAAAEAAHLAEDELRAERRRLELARA
jgi:hypothetical protein